MFIEYFPSRLNSDLKNIEFENLIELRIRIGFPIIAKTINNRILLNKTVYKSDIEYIINELTEHSIYAHNDKILQGYLIDKSGTRIGLTGECVFDKDKIISIKNISSLNIRFSKKINNCSKEILNKIIYNGQVLNTLIISPPTKGKTTILKDLIEKINSIDKYSILLIDERGEFATITGKNIDSIRFCNKNYAFSIAIRSMAPDIVITDEISSSEDWAYLVNAVNCGVNIIATCHGSSLKNIRNKDGFNNKIFDRYIVLKSYGLPGVVDFIYNGEFKVI